MNARPLRYCLIGILFVLAAGANAGAAVLEVAPISIDLASGAQAAAITITSHDPSPVYLQVRGFVWKQSGNTDTLVPTDDIALAPPLFSLPAGTPQVVRIVLEQPASDRERDYRLLIDEIPAATHQNGVQFALRLSLPLFVEPTNDTASRLQPRLEKTPTGQVELVVDNTGTRRDRLIDLAVKTETGDPIKLSSPANPYLLPGAERRWTLQLSASSLPAGSTLRMTAKTDNGPLIYHVAFAS